VISVPCGGFLRTPEYICNYLDLNELAYFDENIIDLKVEVLIEIEGLKKCLRLLPLQFTQAVAGQSMAEPGLMA